MTSSSSTSSSPSLSLSVSSASSSWVGPFLLGVASTLSIVLVSQIAMSGRSCGSGSTSSGTNISSRTDASRGARGDGSNVNINGNYSQCQDRIECNGTESSGSKGVMDRPDLDHRMLRKAEAVIRWRTTRLILVIERCTNNHNYSAILRTAEALGIQIVCIIDPPDMDDDDDDHDEDDRQDDNNGQKGGSTHQQQQNQIKRTPQEIEERRLHHLFAQNATSWLTIRNFETSEECVREIRHQGYQLWVTDLSQEAVPLGMSTPTVPEKVALVMGTEAVGASQYILNEADRRVYLPLRGFADSLNLSVATALILHHIFIMEPSLVGAMDESDRVALRKDWFAKLCQQRILTASQKKQRFRLMGQVQKCQRIQDRIDANPGYKIHPDEQKKLTRWPAYEKELSALDALIDPKRVEAAIQEWVDHPPEPLTDLRRADVHRVCFVGKNTKEIHKEHWKDMVATSNFGSVDGATAKAFREKMLEVSTTDRPDSDRNDKGSEEGSTTASTSTPKSKSFVSRLRPFGGRKSSGGVKQTTPQQKPGRVTENHS